MTRHYATACHRRQLPTLARSMQRHCGAFVLHVLAWDWDPTPALEELAEIETRGEFLARNPELAPDRLPGHPRTAIEQVCTVRWRFLCDVMARTGAPVTAIDGDLMFWSSPEDVFAEIGAAGAALSPHSFAPASADLPGVTIESHARYGLYNGGWVYLADPMSAAWMAEVNRQWSHADFLCHPDGRVTYGDQGYLELLHEQLGAHVIRHPGVNVGPWNVHTQRLALVDGNIYFGGRPLVAYHYSSFRPGVQVADAGYQITERQRVLLYEPYERELAQ